MKGIKDRQYSSSTQASWYSMLFIEEWGRLLPDMPTTLHIQGPGAGGTAAIHTQSPHEPSWREPEWHQVTALCFWFVSSCVQLAGWYRLLSTPRLSTYRINTRFVPSLYDAHLCGWTDLKADFLRFCRSTEKKESFPLPFPSRGSDTAIEK